ncbi:hypothetical protein FPQ18DRAFT_343361 [Pyronema domesticum]|nr:hypothetical protein FPQ18DRAFT_343361 [Pyronema domesticum]
MFFAYDAAFTGSGAAETVGERRERKAREREGSISSSSSSDRTYSSRSNSGSNFRTRQKYPSFGIPGFGSSKRKVSDNSLHPPPSDVGTISDISSVSDHSRPITSVSRSGNRAVSPLPITPSEPASARVVREFAHSIHSNKSGSSSGSERYRLSPRSIPRLGHGEVDVDDHVARRLGGLSMKPPSPSGHRTSQTTSSSRTTHSSTYSTYSEVDPAYEDQYGDNSILNLFPLSPTSSEFGRCRTSESSVNNSPITSPQLPPRTSRSDSYRPSSVNRPLPTIHDDDYVPRGPLPPVPQLTALPKKRKSSSSISTPSAFQLQLSRMENTAPKIMVKRLTEDWSDYGDSALEGLEETLFEQRLWAIVARNWLTGGKPLQCPAHELLLSARPKEGRRILNLYGTPADGWVLAAKYPSCMVITLATLGANSTADKVRAWPPPANHHIAYIPTADDLFPFPDGHFDVVVSGAFQGVVKSQAWLAVLQECWRVVKPGGWLEVQSMDAGASRQGELLTAWVESRLVPGIEDCGLVARPSKRVQYFEAAGFADIKTCKIALPAVGNNEDATKVMVQAGRHYYTDIFKDCLRPLSRGMNEGRLPWWWYNKAIRQECERDGSLFGYMISFGRKEF